MEARTSCEANGREIWSDTASLGEMIESMFQCHDVVGVQESLGKGKR